MAEVVSLFIFCDQNREIVVDFQSSIISKIGGFEPFYFYRLEKELYSSQMLQRENDLTSLHIETVHNGPAEFCSLYLHQTHRKWLNGRYLSFPRFLFLAQNRQFFKDEIVAEMRGQVDDYGISPFWEAVRKIFLSGLHLC